MNPAVVEASRRLDRSEIVDWFPGKRTALACASFSSFRVPLQAHLWLRLRGAERHVHGVAGRRFPNDKPFPEQNDIGVRTMRHARGGIFSLSKLCGAELSSPRPWSLAHSPSSSLSGCEQNSFVPPPPPKVDVAVPAQRGVTRYLEATGNTAPIKNVDLVARVQGVLQSINYQDGSFVKEGTTLFTIEPETYKLKLEQAQAAEAGAQASVKQAEADFKRQTDLVARQAVSQATLDTVHLRARQRPGQSAAGPGQHQDRRGQLRLYQCGRAVRRHRQRASGFGRRTRRRGVADPARDHRRARSDLCEFQCQRTGRAADSRRSRRGAA